MNDNNIINNLLSDFKNNREQLKLMINDIEKYKNKLDEIFPKKFENRYRIFFEEKIKAIIGFFDSILKIRQEINKSLKIEIETRNKIEKYENNIEDEIDIAELANKISKVTSLKVVAPKLETNRLNKEITK